MADQLQVIAFLIDSPGGKGRRRAMIKPLFPSGAPSTVEIPDEVEQTQEAITRYLASKTGTPYAGITWRQPLRR